MPLFTDHFEKFSMDLGLVHSRGLRFPDLLRDFELVPMPARNGLLLASSAALSDAFSLRIAL